MNARTRSGNTVRGFTMVEVLIALFVLAIGLLGLAGMKAASMQANYASYGRTQGINLAYEIVDRMRANRDAALDENYDRALGDAVPACPGTLANCDLREWLLNVQASLPDGDGSIDVDPATGEVFVQTQWDPSRVETSLRDGDDTDTKDANDDPILVVFELRTRL